MPLIYVGGCVSRTGIEKVLDSGFECVQMARSLVAEPDFVNRMANGQERSVCDHVNYCIGRMYTIDMKCHRHVTDMPASLKREVEEIIERDRKRNAQ